LKRFRFLKDLRSYRQEMTTAGSPTSPSPTTLRANASAAATHMLSVDRNRIVFDTFSALSTLRSGGVGGELRKRFRVQFQNELGIDSGGLTKEYFLLLSKQMVQYLSFGRVSSFSPSSTGPQSQQKKWILFTTSQKFFFNEVSPSDLDPVYLPQHPSCSSSSPHSMKQHDDGDRNEKEEEEEEKGGQQQSIASTVIRNYQLLNRIPGKEFIRFVGRMVGKALYDNQMIDVPLSGILLAYMVTASVALTPISREPQQKAEEELKQEEKKARETRICDQFIFTEEDFKDYDPDLHRSLSWMLANNIEAAGLDDTTFTVMSTAAALGSPPNGQQEVLLCKGGDQRVVTEENKREYVQYLIQWKVQYAVATLLQEFLEVSWLAPDC
jgi:hypothetical protein